MHVSQSIYSILVSIKYNSCIYKLDNSNRCIFCEVVILNFTLYHDFARSKLVILLFYSIFISFIAKNERLKLIEWIKENAFTPPNAYKLSTVWKFMQIHTNYNYQKAKLFRFLRIIYDFNWILLVCGSIQNGCSYFAFLLD